MATPAQKTLTDQIKIDYLGSMQEITVFRNSGQYQATIDAHDGSGDIARSEKKFLEELLATLLSDAKRLPAVEKYYAMKRTDNGLAAELDRINLDLDQVELDRQKALADLKGEKLAGALAKCQAKKQSLEARIADCNTGSALFAAEVKDARDEALAGLKPFLAAAVPKALAEAKKRLDAAEDQVGAAIGDQGHLLTLIHSAAAAAKVANLFKEAELATKVERRFRSECVVETRLNAILNEIPAVAAD
jgi:hypothetical protein